MNKLFKSYQHFVYCDGHLHRTTTIESHRSGRYNHFKIYERSYNEKCYCMIKTKSKKKMKKLQCHFQDVVYDENHTIKRRMVGRWKRCTGKSNEIFCKKHEKETLHLAPARVLDMLSRSVREARSILKEKP